MFSGVRILIVEYLPAPRQCRSSIRHIGELPIGMLLKYGHRGRFAGCEAGGGDTARELCRFAIELGCGYLPSLLDKTALKACLRPPTASCAKLETGDRHSACPHRTECGGTKVPSSTKLSARTRPRSDGDPEQPVEACQIVTWPDAVSHPGAGNDVVMRPPLPAEPTQWGLDARIDRYLRAAGTSDQALRRRLTAVVVHDLLSRGAETDWAKIVAAVDRCLASEFNMSAGSEAMPSSRGRVALVLAGTTTACVADVLGADWGTPPRRHRDLRPQDLSLWRPNADWLLRLRPSRSVRGIVACLCSLAVLIFL